MSLTEQIVFWYCLIGFTMIMIHTALAWLEWVKDGRPPERWLSRPMMVSYIVAMITSWPGIYFNHFFRPHKYCNSCLKRMNKEEQGPILKLYDAPLTDKEAG